MGSQAAFISGRRASDNIILVQEAIHSARTSKGKDGWMVIKIDLKKAFDRLEWSFIRDMLIFFKFPSDLISLIMSCVTNPSLSVIVNGTASESCHATRGIRQGDPISPYLFILCMEFLSLCIEKEVISGNWCPIRIGKGDPKVSHALFADDIIFFAKANNRNCESILNTLDFFCERSGQKVNVDKSKIWFSPTVSEESSCRITRNLDFRKTNNLGLYLGHPILDAIVDYNMQVSHLPAATLEEVDRIQRNFVWGDGEENKKIHLVGWDRITRSKKRGGLNLRKAKLRNIALMAKLVWRAKKNPEDLWVKAINSKYKLLELKKRVGSNSDVWTSMMKGVEVFRKGCRHVIKSGGSTNFWHDHWMDNHSLRSLISGPLMFGEEELMVKDCIGNDGEWNLDKISFCFPLSISSKILSTAFCFQGEVSDSFCWYNSSNGQFSLSSAYDIAADFDHAPENPMFWKKLWSTHCHNRIKFFLWLLAHDKICTKSLLCHRNISPDLCCDLCPDSEEDAFHIMRNCVLATSIWNLCSSLPSNFFSQLNLFDWLSSNLSSSFFSNGIPWNILFSYICWGLWKSRNIRLFQGHVLTSSQVFNEYHIKAVEFFHIGLPAAKMVSSLVDVCWNPPPQGWFKLNSDGSSVGNPGSSGAGGIIRKDTGEWFVGYVRKIHCATSLQAEFWGLRDGLTLAVDHGISFLDIAVDAKNVISLLNDADIDTHPLGNIIYDCRKLMERIQNIKISHSFREANQAADAFANRGRMLDESFVVYNCIPDFVMNILIANTMGISFPRSVNSSNS
ncbi:reverse transcriptase [Corchorus capsularis]|uniref:Reverse transcriptase n=1 Tax=Corchorus capsularis TaxID=210143 RepID=A0A1R3K1V3_COCAP|nr:reverse transcriptase [Corchorus capsularis]